MSMIATNAAVCTSVAPQRRTFGTIARTINGLISLHRSRVALNALDARALRDVGLSAEQARAEAQRPIWDVPSHWRM